VGVPRLQELFETLLGGRAEGSGLERAAMRKAALDLVLTVIACGSRRAHHHVDDDIRRTVRWADAHLGEPVPDARLAAEAGLSLSRFRAKFRTQMGMTAHEYVLRRKIDRAMQLLQDTSRTITQVAHALAFASSQYFATVFKRFTLRTPREFVREAHARPVVRRKRQRGTRPARR
jgi:AraC-like DNA-binding protein